MHPKHMLKLMSKKIFTIFRSKSLFNKIYGECLYFINISYTFIVKLHVKFEESEFKCLTLTFMIIHAKLHPLLLIIKKLSRLYIELRNYLSGPLMLDHI